MHVPLYQRATAPLPFFWHSVFGLEWVPMRCELIEDRCASIVRAITRVYTTVRVVIITGSRLLGDREIDGQRLRRMEIDGRAMAACCSGAGRGHCPCLALLACCSSAVASLVSSRTASLLSPSHRSIMPACWSTSSVHACTLNLATVRLGKTSRWISIYQCLIAFCWNYVVEYV